MSKEEKNDLIKVELTLAEWAVVYYRLSYLNVGMSEEDFGDDYDQQTGGVRHRMYKIEQKLIKQIENIKQIDIYDTNL